MDREINIDVILPYSICNSFRELIHTYAVRYDLRDDIFHFGKRKSTLHMRDIYLRFQNEITSDVHNMRMFMALYSRVLENTSNWPGRYGHDAYVYTPCKLYTLKEKPYTEWGAGINLWD